MNSETYLDFVFVRDAADHFASDIHDILTELFKGVRVNWYLEEKRMDGAEIVVAEVKGMSRWQSEEETLAYLEQQGGDDFWSYLQGYKMFIYPAKRGCESCGSH
ncbi:hypothetical protein LS684_09825 [Cytobacillus spongiae]|jgi:hypothetical protein|uniref:hypothetical protein n=1 Tax=Cytobacillus spongiae TaxID=2901381 RepID=UPI001F38F694|nr:hypothetical protein [Cytobacillus spongiae]UII57689.1 hypothetical protein LS684_09825 [Cytobacillus spongiae]